jgi:hypothetical protein
MNLERNSGRWTVEEWRRRQGEIGNTEEDGWRGNEFDPLFHPWCLCLFTFEAISQGKSGFRSLAGLVRPISYVVDIVSQCVYSFLYESKLFSVPDFRLLDFKC